MFTFSIFSDHVLPQVQTQRIPAEGVLYLQGTEAQSLYHVKAGIIKLIVHPEEDKRLVAFRAMPGELLGDNHLFLDECQYTAIADEDSVVESINKDVIKEDILANPQVALAFIKCQTERYDQLRMNFQRLGIGSAKKRILQFLRENQNGEGEVQLRGTLKSFSDDLNLTHETVYRMIAELEKEGAIERDGDIFRVRDAEVAG